MNGSMNAAERWARHDAAYEDNDNPDMEAWLQSFAVKPNGDLVIFDEDGYFTLEFRNVINPEPRHEGAGRWLYACDPDGTPHEIYCEPIWISGYFDAFDEERGRQ
jgi:hypothetical protein